MKEIESFEALPLAAPLLRALRDKNYSKPSEIQSEAIPLLLEGHDLLGAAQTGTGKTAAFALPILQKIHDNPKPLRRNGMRALILTPTRELAVQVAGSFSDYGRHMRVSVETVYGGVSMFRQIQAMKRGVDVLVATPGRLLDLRNQGHIDFSEVEFFVLDEADRMLDMGFIHDIRKVLVELPKERQSLFFSATLSPDINELAHDILSDPKEVRLTPKVTTAEKIDHQVCYVSHDNKLPLLVSLLKEQSDSPGKNLVLIFTRTKFRADKIARALERDGFRTEAIHGNKSQASRQRALENFRRGKAPVLVATDVAARGIDVKNVSLVVNLDMPDEPEAYVHRIGRTARGGAEGTALTFCTHENMKELFAIEKLIKAPIPVLEDHPYHEEKLVRIRKAAAEMQQQSGRRSNSKRTSRGQDFQKSGKPPKKFSKNRSSFKGGKPEFRSSEAPKAREVRLDGTPFERKTPKIAAAGRRPVTRKPARHPKRESVAAD